MSSPAVARAHEAGTSALIVDVTGDHGDVTVSGVVQVPLDRLDLARGTSYASDTTAVVADAEELRQYVADHLAVTDSAGNDLDEAIGTPRVEDVDGVAHLVADVTYGGAATDDLTVTSDIVIETLRSHRVVVVVDEATSESSGDQVVAGTIDLGTPSVVLAAPSTETTITRSVVLGLEHVLDGLDHLLFVACLLLVAPLAAAGRRWRRSGDSAGVATRRVVHTATAFTIAHSLTLVAAARGWVVLPTAVIETVIGLSLLVAAIHVVRPLVPGRRRAEVGIAFGFGLVHGLAFAALTASLGVDGSSGVLTLLGFNLGVELAQLVVVATVLPSLLLLARTSWYRPVSVALAVVAGALAAGWTVERAGGPASPFAPVESAVQEHPVAMVLTLAAVALAATVASALGRRPSTERFDGADPAMDHDPAVSLSGGPTVA